MILCKLIFSKIRLLILVPALQAQIKATIVIMIINPKITLNKYFKLKFNQTFLLTKK